MDYLIIGLYILFVLNVFLFFVLLFRKIKNKKINERNKVKKSVYKRQIEKYMVDEQSAIPVLKSNKERALFVSVLLEEISSTDGENRQKCCELSRTMGFIKIEQEQLNKRKKARKAIAAYRLGEFAATEATTDLLDNINKDNKELSYIIFRSLVLLTGTEYLDRIIAFFGEEDFTNKARILDLISTVKRDIYPKMREYLEGENPLKKAIAYESLANRKDVRVIPHIESGIASPNKEVKIATLKAMIGTNSLECEKILPMIRSLQHHPEWEIRAFFINALRPCGDNQESVEILKKMTGDCHYQVRFNAAEKLLELGEPGMVALSELLYSRDRFVVDKVWSLINREMTLYHLLDTLKKYSQYEYIMENIEGEHNQSIERGVLDVGD